MNLFVYLAAAGNLAAILCLATIAWWALRRCANERRFSDYLIRKLMRVEDELGHVANAYITDAIDDTSGDAHYQEWLAAAEADALVNDEDRMADAGYTLRDGMWTRFEDVPHDDACGCDRCDDSSSEVELVFDDEAHGYCCECDACWDAADAEFPIRLTSLPGLPLDECNADCTCADCVSLQRYEDSQFRRAAGSWESDRLPLDFPF